MAGPRPIRTVSHRYRPCTEGALTHVRHSEAASAAKANVRAAVPGIEAYNADNSAGYTGLTLAKLTAYDQGIKNVVFLGSPNTTSYCVKSTVGTKSWYKQGPGGDITTNACTGP